MSNLLPIDFAAAPAQPRLGPGEVHLWRADLQGDPTEYSEVLSPEEWVRAGRFHFERDRRRFIAAHGLLRIILAKYTGIAAHDLRFGAGPHGKPLLEPNFTGLQFNLSHSDELMLLAVTRSREVGVDLEFMRENVPFESLAAHYFPPTDAWHIRTSPPAERAGLFYETWTITEARLKAAGTGFAEPATVVQPDRWSLRTLTPASGYAAALAVEGDPFELRCWSWQK
ncbi:MAG TPA: 4'-phosphopantetheinyl transferase superfamily protein [Chthoniobacteraceae bacterium]|jgi:4'-phosphopantetheinyl transferase|nr:4'-phosphopantetheinyl transferase superfamily protein [Chthoniobacteraceae bacterium]